MTAPTIHGIRPIYSASTALQTLGDALGEIKAQDRLTWADIGRVLGKSEDQAAKYAEGSAEMGVVSYGLAKREWNGRFTGPFDRLCTESRPRAFCDNSAHSAVIRAALAIAEAKENGGQIFPWEVRMSRAVLEQARDAIEDLLNMDSKVDA